MPYQNIIERIKNMENMLGINGQDGSNGQDGNNGLTLIEQIGVINSGNGMFVNEYKSRHKKDLATKTLKIRNDNKKSLLDYIDVRTNIVNVGNKIREMIREKYKDIRDDYGISVPENRILFVNDLYIDKKYYGNLNIGVSFYYTADEYGTGRLSVHNEDAGGKRINCLDNTYYVYNPDGPSSLAFNNAKGIYIKNEYPKSGFNCRIDSGNGYYSYYDYPLYIGMIPHYNEIELRHVEIIRTDRPPRKYFNSPEPTQDDLDFLESLKTYIIENTEVTMSVYKSYYLPSLKVEDNPV